MIFSNLSHDNWWSRDHFSNQITDAAEACQSNEEFIIQSQAIKYIIQTSKQVTTIQYICSTGSQSYYINIKTSKMLAQRYKKDVKM
jgi:hypothetical protein